MLDLFNWHQFYVVHLPKGHIWSRRGRSDLNSSKWSQKNAFTGETELHFGEEIEKQVLRYLQEIVENQNEPIRMKVVQRNINGLEDKIDKPFKCDWAV